MDKVNFALFATAIVLVSTLLLPSFALSVFSKPLQRLYNSYSLNWAGYYVTGSTYNYASATWTVPSVKITNSGYSSAWVGIGGVNGNQYLIQTGTEQDCIGGATTGGQSKFHGLMMEDSAVVNVQLPSSSKKPSCNPIYYAWWEIYPVNAEQVIPNFSVYAGDTITASVQQTSTPGVWLITISDTHKGKTQTFTTTQTFSPDQSTAEAIIERPALCFVSCQLTNLANFGTITFSNAAVGSSTSYFNLLPNTIVSMTNNAGKILANTGSLSNPGTFSVNWVKSS
jgi:hypothetical protein